MINYAVIYHYIFRRNASVTTGLVLAGLHTDCIIADIEGAMTDDYILATLYIHAVTVLAIPGVTNIEMI